MFQHYPPNGSNNPRMHFSLHLKVSAIVPLKVEMGRYECVVDTLIREMHTIPFTLYTFNCAPVAAESEAWYENTCSILYMHNCTYYE